jgi:hypothetical protein
MSYQKWRCEHHIIEEATDFGVCDLAIFPAEKKTIFLRKY